MSTTEPIRNKHQVRELTEFYLKRGELRNHILVSISVHTALRISDILRLNCDDVYNFKNKQIRETITVIEKKTGKSKVIALNKHLVNALKLYFPCAKPGMPLILNVRTGNAISRIQAYRLIRAAAETLNFTNKVSCHSLRKTFGYHAWKSGVSPAVIMDIYNHSSMTVTSRYLGVTQDDKNKVYLGLDYTA